MPLPAVYLHLWPHALLSAVTSHCFTLQIISPLLACTTPASHSSRDYNKSKKKDALKIAFSLWLQDLSAISAGGFTDGQERKSWASISGEARVVTQRAARPSSAKLLPVSICWLWSHPEAWVRVSGPVGRTHCCIMYRAKDVDSSICRLIPQMTRVQQSTTKQVRTEVYIFFF